VKNPLRVGAASAPKTSLRVATAPPLSGRAKRIANLSAAVAMVVGIGAASAIFVDYLADRALARGVETPASPVVAKVVEPAAATQVASMAPETTPGPAPVPEAEMPMPAPIEARMPDATEIASVAAVGPEHAIEEPTDDPTASPVIHIEELGGGEEVSLDEAAPDPNSAIDEGADATETAAISPDEAEPVAAAPAQKPRKAKAKAAAEPARRNAKIASLPGVDIGGLAGYAADENDVSDSTVRTVTKPAAKTASKGGVTAGAARVTSAVNMRSGPRKGAGVLGVVPAGSNVKVLSCDGWCQISFNGRKGWVYKSFLAAGKKQAAGADAPARKAQSSRL